MELICEPIKDDNGVADNVLLKDTKGFLWALIFEDAFYDKNDSEVYDAIKKGEPFSIEVTLT